MSEPTFANVLKQLEETPGAPAKLGRAIAHCAQGIEYSVSGFPKLKPAWFQATVGKLVLRKFLRQGFMRHDLEAPVPGAPQLPEEIPFADAVERLQRAITAFEQHAGPLAPHFAYGPVERGDYERIHVLHLRDHLERGQ